MEMNNNNISFVVWEEEFTLHLYNIIHEINRANNKQTTKPTNNKGSYKITWCCFSYSCYYYY